MIYKYIRFSTDAQDRRQQENTIDSWLSRNGLVADDIIMDEAVSGDAAKRKRKLFTLAKAIQVGDILVVSEISRITRSGFAELDELIRDYFKPNHLRLVICNVGLDIDCSQIDAITEMQLAMLSIFAKMEKELIRGRTKSALDTRKDLLRRNGGFFSKSGRWTTGLGRQKGTNGHSTSEALSASWDERIASDPIRRRQWLTMKDLYSRGATYEEIAGTLNAVGDKTPRGHTWSKAGVRGAIYGWRKYFIKDETGIQQSIPDTTKAAKE